MDLNSKSVLDEARKLYDLGFATIWLRPKSKIPVESGWTTGPRAKWEYLGKTYSDGLNLGVRLGSPSKIGNGYLCVIDVDIKSTDQIHKKECLKSVKQILNGVECPVALSGRGNGSRHYYCVTDKPFKTVTPFRSNDVVRIHSPSKKVSKKERETLTDAELESGIRLSHAWEVSLYSDGRQVVLPPSIHPDTGKSYSWFKSGIDALPSLDLSLFLESETKNVGAGLIGLKSNPDAFKARDFKFTEESVDISWLPISDEVRGGIIDGIGVLDRSGFLLRASSALLSAGLSENEVLNVLTDPKVYIGSCAYDHAKTMDRRTAAAWVYRYTLARVVIEKSVAGIFGPASEALGNKKLNAEEMEKQNEEFSLEILDWRKDLDRTKFGIKATLKNIDLIFSNSIDGAVFVKDLFTTRVSYGSNTPWGGIANSYISDIDMILIKRWLSDTEFKIEPSKELLFEATDLIAHRFQSHPVQDWLHSLTWDGIERVSTWIKDTCQGRAEEPYLSEISRKFLLAMVKRVFEPGCQWDYTLVLEGGQGNYKSSIARALASDKWFMDNLPDLRDKDAMLNLQGKWLIELGELASVKRSDYNLVKQYLSKRVDYVRPHYGRVMTDVPRQSVFIGTVNDGQYLKDPTGNRRFWPVKVGKCNVKYLKEIRDQLFAEAFHIYKTTNEVLKLSPEADAQAVDAQNERRIDDDDTEMTECLLEFLKTDLGKKITGEKLHILEFFNCENAPWKRWDPNKPFVLKTAAQVLLNCGFIRPSCKGYRRWEKSENWVDPSDLKGQPKIDDFY